MVLFLDKDSAFYVGIKVDKLSFGIDRIIIMISTFNPCFTNGL